MSDHDALIERTAHALHSAYYAALLKDGDDWQNISQRSRDEWIGLAEVAAAALSAPPTDPEARWHEHEPDCDVIAQGSVDPTFGWTCTCGADADSEAEHERTRRRCKEYPEVVLTSMSCEFEHGFHRHIPDPAAPIGDETVERADRCDHDRHEYGYVQQGKLVMGDLYCGRRNGSWDYCAGEPGFDRQGALNGDDE